MVNFDPELLVMPFGKNFERLITFDQYKEVIFWSVSPL